MSLRQCAGFACAVVLSVQPQVGAAQSAASSPSASAPAPAGVWRARTALRFNPASRCRDIVNTGETDSGAALVLFQVGTSGVPSEPAIRSSSGSERLDAAAIACVQQLRFYPALSRGEGAPIVSWQQMAFRWKTPPPQPAQAAQQCAPGATSPAAAQPKDNDAGSKRALPGEAKADVCVCVDETGKLAQQPTILQSTGDARFDQAAVALASAGHYTPSIQGGKAVANCSRITVRVEVK